MGVHYMHGKLPGPVRLGSLLLRCICIVCILYLFLGSITREKGLSEWVEFIPGSHGHGTNYSLVFR